MGRKALSVIAIVAKPETILAWYRRLVAQKFDGSKQRKDIGRPPVAREVVDLVVRMAKRTPAGATTESSERFRTSGATTQWNGDESSCTGGCSGFASANANWLQGQLVGNSQLSGLDGYIQFLTGRIDPVSGFSQVAFGPLDASDSHWVGPGGAGPPGGAGDWRASMHDYNFATNGLNGYFDGKGITIGMYFNPTLPPAT